MSLCAGESIGRKIFKKDNRPLFWSVIDESVLYRPFGGNAVISPTTARPGRGRQPAGHRNTDNSLFGS